MKNLIIILAILFLSGCQTIEKYSQCERDKNYVNVNNALFDEYKANYENGNIKSYYFDIGGKCRRDSCFHAYNKLKFFEYNFDNNEFKGIYRVDILKDYSDEKCYYKKFNKDNICYLMTKIDKPISRYHMHMKSKDNSHYEKLRDVYKNDYVIEYNYQIYSKMSISGAPTGSMCDVTRNKNEYNLNSFDIPYR